MVIGFSQKKKTPEHTRKIWDSVIHRLCKNGLLKCLTATATVFSFNPINLIDNFLYCFYNNFTIFHIKYPAFIVNHFLYTLYGFFTLLQLRVVIYQDYV